MSISSKILTLIRASSARRPPPKCGFLSSARSPRYRRYIHTIQKCPPASCSCRETPQGLDIDHEKQLRGTVPSYAEHVVVSTGRSDWPSKIEDDAEVPLVAALKTKLGRDGRFSNPFHNVMITTSSHSNPSLAPRLMLFPSCVQVDLPILDSSADWDARVDELIKAFILPTELRLPTAVQLPPVTRANLTRDESKQLNFVTSSIRAPMILICGHGGRDQRCGILGPLLEDEFKDKLLAAGIEKFSVALISHIGGHRFAGNVIVYIPPSMASPLAGKGIWYGRVEPKHVEGIVNTTIVHGTVIEELLRGGIERAGSPMRI